MKFCEEDGCQKEAKVHITRVVDEVIKKVHLCEGCAANLGVDSKPPENITDFLLNQVGSGSSSSSKTNRASIMSTCASCGMDRPRLKKNMRMGCKHCYSVFADDLEPVIQSMHHSKQHVGKVPSSEGKRAKVTRELAILNEKLAKAVLQEQFEDAAELRDSIRKLEAEMVVD